MDIRKESGFLLDGKVVPFSGTGIDFAEGVDTTTAKINAGKDILPFYEGGYATVPAGTTELGGEPVAAAAASVILPVEDGLNDGFDEGADV